MDGFIRYLGGMAFVFMGLMTLTGRGIYHGYSLPPAVGFFMILIGILSLLPDKK